MNDPIINLFSPILSKFQKLKQRQIELYKNVVSSITFFSSQHSFEQSIDFEKFNTCLHNFIEISKQAKVTNRETSYEFNMLSFFSIKETMHSYLLAYLLDPYESHGQGDLFLMDFLKLLKIDLSTETPNESDWIITAEKERIDVRIKRKYPYPIIVVIENKSHNAEDQLNQLYRYWYYQIYLFQKNLNLSSEKSEYHIIYLAPNDWKKPTKNSLSKSKDIDCEHNTIPHEILYWQFSKEITEWLTNSIKHLSDKNHRLREYLLQYIEIINQLR